jgi:hypothetical protein
MLIVLRHPDGLEASAEYAKLVAGNLNGTTRIYNPRSLADYTGAINKYSVGVKKHLILLSTFKEHLATDTPPEIERQFTWALINKAALEYGVAPTGSTLSTLVEGGLPKDPVTVAKNAYVSTKRALDAKKYLGAGYTGRLTTDPHTVLVGYGPNTISCEKISGIMRQIISSLPVEWGRNTDDSRASDWSGVSFLKIPNNDERWSAIRTWLEDSSNFVAIGEKAHQTMTRVGLTHGAVPAPVGNGKFNSLSTTPKYGLLIRDVAKTNEHRLEWKP